MRGVRQAEEIKPAKLGECRAEVKQHEPSVPAADCLTKRLLVEQEPSVNDSARMGSY